MDEFDSIQPTLTCTNAQRSEKQIARVFAESIARGQLSMLFEANGEIVTSLSPSPLLFFFSGSHAIDPCASKYCGIGKECELSPNNTIAVCVCMRKCPRRHRPVCASNGKIYANHCELHRAACHSGSSLTKSRLMRCLHHGKNCWLLLLNCYVWYQWYFFLINPIKIY